MDVRILILNITVFSFFMLSFTQYAFADEPLCGIGKEITSITQDKELYQQQAPTNQIADIINAVTGAMGNILGGGGSRITNQTIEQLLSIFFTLATRGTAAQGYVCIPQSTYYDIVDNLSNIILKLR